MVYLDEFVVTELPQRVDYAIDVATPLARTLDENSDNNSQVSPRTIDVGLITAEFLMMTRALPASARVDDIFTRLYRHLASLSEQPGLDEETLRTFGEEYSLLTRVARKRGAVEDVMVATEKLEAARDVLEDANVVYESDRSQRSWAKVEFNREQVQRAQEHLSKAMDEGIAALNDLAIVAEHGVFWGAEKEP